MVRSMYSGVSGLRAHQTRMDTIGNNIANVNTYGFKSGRTTFRDIYYQQVKGATEPTGAMGGVNPSAVGYGSKVGSVDLMMDRSTFSMTDQTMDLAIDGEGFFQVQDAAGNTFYTRAGMLSFDAIGNLVDMQGNYVLGVNGDPTGRGPSSERISVVLGAVEPAPATTVQTINGKEFTITSTNNSPDGNMNLSFTTDASLADGDVVASIASTGIVIKMHPENTYTDLDSFNSAINAAITQANNNTAHPAGDFVVSYTGDPAQDPFETLAAGEYLTAKEICSTNYGIVKGNLSLGASFWGGMSPSGNVGNTFGSTFPSADPVMSAITGDYSADKWTFKMTIDGVVYEGEVEKSKNTSGKFKLYNTASSDVNDFIELNRPSFDKISDAWKAENGGAGTPAEYVIAKPATAAAAATWSFDSVNYTTASTGVDAEMIGFAAAINAAGNYRANYNATTGEMSITSLTNAHVATAPNFAVGAAAAPAAFKLDASNNPIQGVDPAVLGAVEAFKPINATSADPDIQALWAKMGDRKASASNASKSLGLSGAAFPLRGGTAGGPQTLADMTGIQIGTNGVIVGWDSVGKEITIGRIDLVTFANPSGLNQAGSSNYTASANSGDPIKNIPGQGGAGQLVGGSLELSNVDLSREFSDMITTQRGYQANSRIITVSDTMLEELINLKR